MAEIHVYKGGTTDALDGTLVSEDDSGLSAVAIQSVAAGQAVHMRCSPGYQTAASVYIVPPSRFEVSADNSTYVASTLDLGVVDDENVVFYVKQTEAFTTGDDDNVRFFVQYGGSFTSIPAAPIFDNGPTVYDVTSNSCKIAASYYDPNGETVTATYRVVTRGSTPNWTGADVFVSPQGVSSLTGGTDYDAYVRITDGTLATVSAAQQFTTGAIGNSAPSSFTPTTASVTASSVKVSFSTSDVDGDTLTYKVAVTATATPPAVWTGYSDRTSPYTWSGLSSSTSYYAHVRAYDGSLATVGTSAVFTTGNTAPSAFSIAATTITHNSAVISGTTTDPDGDTVTYKYKVMLAASAAPSTTDAAWNSASAYTSPQTVSVSASTAYKAHVRASDGKSGYRVATTATFVTDANPWITAATAVTTTAGATPSAVPQGNLIARYSNDMLVTAYFTGTFPGRHVRFAKSTDYGATWAEDDTVPTGKSSWWSINKPNADDWVSPAFATDASGNIHTLYVVRSADFTGTFSVYYQKATVSGTTLSWGDPVRIDYPPDSTVAVTQPVIVVDSAGECHAVWMKSDSASPYSLRYSYTVNGTWQTPATLSAALLGRPSLAIDTSDNLHLSYAADDAGTRKVYYQRRKDGSWETAVRLINAAVPASADQTSCIVCDNYVHVAFTRDSDGAVVYVKSANPANGASAPFSADPTLTTIKDDTNVQGFASLACDRGKTLYLAYRGKAGSGTYEVIRYQTAANTGSGTWAAFGNETTAYSNAGAAVGSPNIGRHDTNDLVTEHPLTGAWLLATDAGTYYIKPIGAVTY